MKIEERLSDEKKLVVLNSRLSNVNTEQMLTLLNNDLDWDKVFMYASRNKILYVLYNNLKKQGFDKCIPQYMRNLIEDSLKCNKIRNNVKLSELELVCKKMDENGVKIVPVKGAYMIDNVYKNRSIRTTNDLDALILKKDILKIEQIMRELGYTNEQYDDNTKSFVKRSATQRMLYKTKMYNLLPYVKLLESPIEMNVIFDLSHSLDFSLDVMPVQEMIASSFLEKGIRKLLPEHYFVHMCCHHYREASHVEWLRIGKDLNLIKFCDIREFVINKMDDAVMCKAINFAKKHNIEKAIYFVLFFLRIIYNDGYEEKWMNELTIENKDFVFMFGEDEVNKTQLRKKDFWNSFFDSSNADEIIGKVRYDEVMQ